ncbi:MAG: HAD-IIB family hydrolase [Pseudomonadales bacterium]
MLKQLSTPYINDSPRDTNDMQVLVFTDLDGTLLDHHTYRYDDAQALIDDLRADNIPLIYSSSKTKAEIEPLRTATENQHPFIVENGSAVHVPKDYFGRKPHGTVLREDCWVKEFAEPRTHWLQILKHLQTQFDGCFESFSELGAAGIAKVADMPLEEAALANQRQYSEPLLWTGDTARRQAFINELIRAGAFVQQGGRFLNINGNGDKGSALRWLLSHYRDQQPTETFHTISLGDSQNDAPMLEASDTAIIVRSPVKDPPRLQRQKSTQISVSCGPLGWSTTLRATLQSLEASNG